MIRSSGGLVFRFIDYAVRFRFVPLPRISPHDLYVESIYPQHPLKISRASFSTLRRRPRWHQWSFYPNKLIYSMVTLIPKTLFMIIKTNNVRGDLSDISAKTATLPSTAWLSAVSPQNIVDIVHRCFQARCRASNYKTWISRCGQELDDCNYTLGPIAVYDLVMLLGSKVW